MGNAINHYVSVGAGIDSLVANVTVTGSLIANNTATGNLSLGGGIAMETGFVQDAANVLTIANSTFEGNQAIGTSPYGSGYGGAIHVDPFATISVTNSSFLHNETSGGITAQGGAMDLDGLVQGTSTGSQFVSNQAVLSNSTFCCGTASGGAISNEAGYIPGILSISNSTFTTNLAEAGAGGGSGLGGAISNWARV